MDIYRENIKSMHLYKSKIMELTINLQQRHCKQKESDAKIEKY